MIPAEAIAEVKARVELVSFIEAQGIELKRAGKGYMGLCVFHPDTRPSLSVDPARQYWCCLGACSAGGEDHRRRRHRICAAPVGRELPRGAAAPRGRSVGHAGACGAARDLARLSPPRA